MKLTERQLLHIAAVIKAGGLTEGAALIGLTQPALSRTVSEVERRIGEPLFVRGRRPLQPTPLGKRLGEQGMVILTALRKASEEIEAFQTGRSGVIRVGGVPFFMDAFISTMIAEFSRASPDIRVAQSYGHVPELISQLLSDQLDLAICPMGGGDRSDRLEFTEILPARNVIACRVGHPLGKTRRLASRDLLDFPWISPLPGSPLLADLHSILLTLGAPTVSISYSGGSLMSVLNYLTETDALTVLPHSVVFAFRKRKTITMLPYDLQQPERALGLLYCNDTAPVPAAARLAGYIEEQFASLRHLIRRHESAVVWGR